MELQVTSHVLETLREHALAAAPAECCGLLLGRGDTIERVQPAANVAADPLRFFEIDPAALVAAHRAEREGGPRVIGYYHSHPGGGAEPSATDCEHSTGDLRIWAIIGRDEVAFWRDCGKGFAATTLRTVDGGRDQPT